LMTHNATAQDEVQQHVVLWDRCTWLCGARGEFLECGSTGVMAGSCGSASSADCRHPTYCPESGRFYVALLCCSLRVSLGESN